ncbi:armadillo-type protein [Lasiosphaeria hispida]|uniref:Armadillo-type protein n=1 Tax=Lasiosphaeria hispida TaxID=260671 RepID=A0AAJ0HWT6_9PEZI|nr:armadillo-type protein [Lasiosphaeria hispida]
MMAVSFSQGISAGRTTALCLLVGAVAVWLWLYPAPTPPDPALLAPAGPASDPRRSTRKVNPKNKTDTFEDALEPEEGLTREGGTPPREASSHPEHGQRQKDQTEPQHQKDQTEPNNPTQFHPRSKGVTLRQVYPSPEDKTATDVDIIAIHGLDTQSPDTWIWDPKGTCVNWLEDPHMLPKRFPTARIFTCDWPADLFEQPGFVQKMIDEFARLLLAGIKGRPPATNDQSGHDRPIVFIASCLGGIILAKALVMASREYESVKRATGGIVFLATPFRGTSFQPVAPLAELGLSLWASIRDKNVSNLLELVKSTFDLEELARSFTTLCQENKLTDRIFIFYETGKSSLPRKIVPWLPDSLSQVQPLVNRASATLDIVPHPLPLDRPHVTMNKFSSSDDPGYVSVAGVVDILLCDIRHGRPMERADLWIRNNCYSLAELKIERLSGDLLPMDRCYINLAIVEQPGDKICHSDKGTAQKASPFSLLTRLKVERPDKTVEVTLPTLFKPRKARDGQEKRPSRILIRGQAGVGKTTLCKKIVHDFTYSKLWQDSFNRVLWVPLRNLKRGERRRSGGYNFGHLFHDEYFSQHLKGGDLAEALWHALGDTKSGRTLFILDGLDEVSQDLDGGMLDFLKKLLNQPNVIITSRPHAMLPPGLDPIQLELETIGFYPDQVRAYVEKAFTDPETGETDSEKPSKIQSYLQKHQLVQGLVRIPVQLDALCYTWSSFNDKLIPQTMTAIYTAIEQSLWKKDIVRLGKQQPNGQQVVTHDYVKELIPSEVEDFAKAELSLLEGLAFTGLHNDVIDFQPEHRDVISRQFKPAGLPIPLVTTCTRLSFLRTSEPLSDNRRRNYHFLHLTFQEYFAARYFVRQWKAKQPLNCLRLSNRDCNNVEPATFLQEHKYNPRYDIFWRFITGLLDADREALGFFQTIEKEPRDLLGPTHQRLVMHCLSEVERKESTFVKLRAKLENQLEQWLLFECDFMKSSSLACEMECPEQVLVNALKQASEDTRLILLESLSTQTTVPSGVINITSPWLNDYTSQRLCIAILRMLKYQHMGLPDKMLQEIIKRLEDEDEDVRWAAVEALQGQADLPEVLQGIAKRLEDKSQFVRLVAVKALQGQADLPEEMLQGIAKRLKDKDTDVRQAAIELLQGRADLPEEVLQGIAKRLKDEDRYIQHIAVKMLQGRVDLPKKVLQEIDKRLKDKDRDIRQAAVETLQGRADLPKKMLQGIAKRLKYRDRGIRQAAVKVLQGQADLPKEVLQGIVKRLEGKDRNIWQAAVEALQGRADLPEKVLQGITKQLEHKDRDTQLVAVQALQGWADLPKEILQEIVKRLEDKDRNIRRAAVEALQGQADLPKVLQEIAKRLEDEDQFVRQAAVEALQGQADLPKEVLQGIVKRLEDKDRYVQWLAINVLRGQADLPEEVLQGIAKQLKDKDRDIQQAAIYVLQGQADLPKGVLQGIAKGLEYEDIAVRQVAIKLLQGQADLPEEVLQGIAKRLEDEDRDIRQGAVEMLQGQVDLPKKMLQGIAKRLEDEDQFVQQAAVKALQGQADLPKEVLQRIVKRLEDEDSDIQKAAVKVLQGRADLPEKVLQGITKQLEHKDRDTQLVAVQALQGWADLPKEILQEIVKRLEDKDRNIRRAAVEALQGQADLPKEVLQGITKQLEHKDRDTQLAAVWALHGRADLPKGVLQGIAKGLKDEDRDIRQGAVEMLRGRADLPEEMLQGITKQLKDKDRDIQQAAIYVLQGQADLPKGVLQGIAKGLEYEDIAVRQVAIKLLQGQADLPEEVLQGIAKRLEDENWYVQQEAVKVLISQAALSLDVLSPYVKPLHKALLRKSFGKHLYWHPLDSGFIGVDLRRIILSGRQYSREGIGGEVLLEKGANWEETVVKLLQLNP